MSGSDNGLLYFTAVTIWPQEGGDETAIDMLRSGALVVEGTVCALAVSVAVVGVGVAAEEAGKAGYSIPSISVPGPDIIDIL